MDFFYSKVFPFNLFDRWLNYGNNDLLKLREFSFTISRAGREYYLRWRSYPTITALKDAILAMDPPPQKIDIGAIYNFSPNEREVKGTSNHVPIGRELIIDIDMNDYDEVRTCCKDKTLCLKCWKFLRLAMTVLTAALEEDFGFKHIMWVYSGRRGVHCWVLDKAARELTNDGRSAVAEYLNHVIPGSDSRQVRFNGALSPSVVRAYNLLLPIFDEMVEEQQFLAKGSPMVKWVDAYMKAGTKKLEQKYTNLKSTSWDGKSKSLMTIVRQVCQECRDTTTPVEIAFALVYPRLDIQVTKDRGHLLKSPFCLHPATNNVCVPIPRDEWASFDPTACPSLTTLRNEFDQGIPLKDTCIGRYLRHFEGAILNPLLESEAENKENLWGGRMSSDITYENQI